VTLTSESESFPLFQHDGVEFLYVLDGRLDYGYGRTTYPLGPGDSLMFDGGVSHGPERLVELPIRFLSITIELDEGAPEA
jgi:mannose-6-phosphate isomerase-like protein (cupin superfamily)